MNLSISDLLPYLACRYGGSMRLEKKAWSAPTDALYLGTALHKHMEWVLAGRVTPEPILPLTDPASIKSFDAMKQSVEGWTMPWKVLDIEREVKIALDTQMPLAQYDGAVLNGRLDAVVEDEKGRRWSLQWKTIGKGQNIGAKLEDVRMSFHELAYSYMYRIETGQPLVGTIVGLFRKSLTKQEALDKVPVFQLYPLLRSQDEVDEAWQVDIKPACRELLASGETAEPRNWTQCAKFGASWRQCPLFDHCHLGVSIDSLGLTPLEERYGSAETTDE